jgi:uncharacterized protein
MRRVGRFLAVVFLLAAPAAHADPTFPPLTGRVVDEAGILSPATRDRLTTLLEQEDRRSTNQIVVVTVKSLQGYPIEQYGYQLGRYWGIGQKDKNNGALLIVAPNERKVRIEVGYGLEGELTDAQSKIIIDSAITPAFKRGDFDAGVLAGVAAMLEVVGGHPLAEPPPRSSAVQGSVGNIIFFVLFAGVWIFVLTTFFFARSGRHTFFGMPVIVTGFGGGMGGGGFSGGGFSGGGSFGGGGASGSW